MTLGTGQSFNPGAWKHNITAAHAELGSDAQAVEGNQNPLASDAEGVSLVRAARFQIC